MKNGWFLNKQNEIAFLNYAFYENNKISISASIIKEKSDFFSTPFSSSKLHIYESDGLLESNKCIPKFKDSAAIMTFAVL